MLLDTKFLLDNLESYKTSLRKRGSRVNVEKIITLGEKRKDLLLEVESLRHGRNQLSSLKEKPTEEIIEKGRKLKEEISLREEELKTVESELSEKLLKVPNLVSEESPLGPEENKKALHSFGEVPKFDFEPRDHEQLGSDLDLIDFERGAKVAGSKFYYMKNEAVLLEFALVNYALNILVKEGFIPIITPEVIKNSVLQGMGFQPCGPETQIY